MWQIPKKEILLHKKFKRARYSNQYGLEPKWLVSCRKYCQRRYAPTKRSGTFRKRSCHEGSANQREDGK